ncbi:hypothetical protein [Streptomyces sp. FH025]|uniref:hypothetical protein n=1 Tax=Streptomyces sp. FH025 TaxID=2815937 RepID=UPI001A9FE2E0|nr:hypothetical protein [Streptomyces sp. FH025]MBO1413550.1 hypothetical protein [Streptomyces sp. FH025]
MNPIGHGPIRHPLPPGIDTLHYRPGNALAAIPDPRHRAMVAEVLASGLVDGMIVRTASFGPPVNDVQCRTAVDVLTAEFEAFGVDVPAATTGHITRMRALMVPIDDDALALAVDRIWVFTTHTDDVCCHDRAEAAAVLRAGLLPDARPSSPTARYVRHMFGEIARFCDPTFLAVWRNFFYNAITGVLMEAEFDPEVSDGIDSDFVRAFNGFSQFWFTTLQFTAPCLRADTHRAFWSAALSSCVAFLNDVNDVVSFYKEAVHGADFATGRIHRRAVAERIPYLEAYREVLAGGEAARHRILDLATEEQRPHLDRYMTGFTYWQLRCRRYRWQDVYPGLAVIDA